MLSGRSLAEVSAIMATQLTHNYFTWGTTPRERTLFTLERILDFGFGLLYSVLAIRALLDFFRAAKGAGFYELIRSLSDPFYAPFRGLFGATSLDGHPVVWPLLVAIFAYMVLHGVLRRGLRLLLRA